MNDEEVYTELKKMVTFIRQEAQEKARELKTRADEEFNIEKAKLVRQESINIEGNFQRKLKQVYIHQKIFQSNSINKSRLKMLSTRQELFNEIIKESRKRLENITADKHTYRELLADLILQSLYQLMEPSVVVICKKNDKDLVRTAVDIAKKKFEEKTKVCIGEIGVSDEKCLPEDCAGGVVVSAKDSRILCDNSLEARLDLLSQQMMPEIRIMLFGSSGNRKFYN